MRQIDRWSFDLDQLYPHYEPKFQSVWMDSSSRLIIYETDNAGNKIYWTTTGSLRPHYIHILERVDIDFSNLEFIGWL